MIGIIVTGHGNFATGITSSVKLIAGMPENYQAVDFVQEDSVDDLIKHLTNAIEALKDCKEGILVFSDLVGGSPFKTSVELAQKLKDQYHIVVLSGTNLGMLIESSMARGYMEDLDALADMAVNTGKDQAMKYVYTERKQEETAGDGI
jgi:PTS system N-acetylgalactosamine-specific IIA component